MLLFQSAIKYNLQVMKNIWNDLKNPIFIMAPLDDVTDTVFRQIIADLAAPDLFFTEFTAVDGLLSEKGSEAAKRRLIHTPKEKPLIAQIWGTDPEKFYEAAKMISKMGFDGIDINMGCPEKSVVKRGACSGLIKNHDLAAQIIQRTKDGANGLPISVKTRIGFREIETEDWISFLLKQDLAAIAIHARTVKEMSKVPAHWDEIGKAVTLRNQIAPQTLIIGNGDVDSYKDGLAKVKEYGVDGIMIGTGIFKNLLIFNPKFHSYTPGLEEGLKLLLKHTKLFVDTWGSKKSFPILKKFYKCYLSGFDGAAEIRAKFMEANNLEEVEKLVKHFTDNPLPEV